MENTNKIKRSNPIINALSDERVLQAVMQIIFIAIIILGLIALANNVISALNARGITPNFAFLQSRAGFGIFGAEGYYSPDDTFLRAFFVGLENTLRVVIIGLVGATLIGIVFGIFLLSGNYLVRTIARVYVEILRNTPLLVQIYAWFFIGIAALPDIRGTIEIPQGSPFVALNNRAIYVADFVASPQLLLGIFGFLLGVIVATIVFIVLGKRMVETGQLIPRRWYALAIIIGFSVIGYIGGIALNPTPEEITIERDDESITLLLQDAIDQELLTAEELATFSAQPFSIVYPERRGLRYVGGTNYSGPYLALLLALTIYTSAFIAEIVRAGIQAVDRGQLEAARAVGLSYSQMMRLIILPQALRVIIPPMGNQYLNLSKNSSLAIAIAYADVFQVSNTIINQSGQTVTMFVLIMATYLTMSLTISAIMNFVNRRFQLVTR